MVFCCCAAVSHICALYPVKIAMKACTVIAVITVIVLIYTAETADDALRGPDSAPFESSLRMLRWHIDGADATTHIERSTSKKTNALFCGNAFTIPANREIITLKGQLESENKKKKKSNTAAAAAGEFVNHHHQAASSSSGGNSFCRVSRTDKEQVQRCRLEDIQDGSTRRLERKGMLAAIARSCHVGSPKANKDDIAGQKSNARCISGRGAFVKSSKSSWALFQKCIVFNIAEELSLKPGHAVLEWGAGCGHTLTMLKQLFDVDGVGVGVEEALASATRWARHHALGHFCQAPSSKDAESKPFASYLLPSSASAPTISSTSPSIQFDGVISIVALARVPSVLGRCTVLREAVQVLRPGARAFFGGFGGAEDSTPQTSWTSWMSQCGIHAADFDKQVESSQKMGHHQANANNEPRASLFTSTLEVASFRPVRELGVYPGTDHKAWKEVLLVEDAASSKRTSRFEGSSFAVVIEK